MTMLAASAQNTATALVLERTDGSNAIFVLSDTPAISFNDGILTVKSQKEDVTVDFDDLIDYHFIKVKSDVKHINAGEGFILQDGTASFSNLKEGGSVDVYSADGRIIVTATVPADGNVMLDLRTIERGIIIIRTDNGSYKVNNR